MPFGRKRTGGYGAGKRKRLQNLQLARDKKISRDESVATTSSATVTTPTRMAGGESSQPSTSRRISATERKFGYAELLREMRVSDFPVEGVREEIAGEGLSTVIVRCSVLPSLVTNLSCTSCKKRTLSIRAVDRTLGMVCGLETFCTSCDTVLNSTLSSDRIGEMQATNSPFVVVR